MLNYIKQNFKKKMVGGGGGILSSPSTLRTAKYCLKSKRWKLLPTVSQNQTLCKSQINKKSTERKPCGENTSTKNFSPKLFLEIANVNIHSWGLILKIISICETACCLFYSQLNVVKKQTEWFWFLFSLFLLKDVQYMCYLKYLKCQSKELMQKYP